MGPGSVAMSPLSRITMWKIRHFVVQLCKEFGWMDFDVCTCGEPESVKHYIEDCEQHVEIRERLMSKLFFTIGSSEWSCKMFLEVKAEDDLQECREILNEIFEEYILSTKRFKTQ